MAQHLAVAAKLERELAEIDDPEEKADVPGGPGHCTESALDKVIAKTYQLLGLISFLTAGEDEVPRLAPAQGSPRPRKAAGVIHTDFEKGFIRAEVIAYADFLEHVAPSRPARTRAWPVSKARNTWSRTATSWSSASTSSLPCAGFENAPERFTFRGVFIYAPPAGPPSSSASGQPARPVAGRHGQLHQDEQPQRDQQKQQGQGRGHAAVRRRQQREQIARE